MAKKRYVNTIFWDDAYVSNLDPSEKLLFIYLITNPCTNISGIYQISLKRVSLDTGIEKEMVLKIFERFQRDNKILYLDGWMAIKNFIKHQNINSPLIIKGIERELIDVPLKCLSFIDTDKYGIDTVLNKHISQGQGLNQGKGKGKVVIPIKNIIPPKVEWVEAYLNEIGETRFTAQYFMDSNYAKGWVVGKTQTKMKDWQATVRTWRKNADERTQEKQNSHKYETEKERGVREEIEKMKRGEGEYPETGRSHK
jgi:hypothetical protein